MPPIPFKPEHPLKSDPDKLAAHPGKPMGAINGDARPQGDVAPFDRMVNTWLGRLTTGLSPTALAVAWTDVFLHTAIAPVRQLDLLTRAATLGLEANARALSMEQDGNSSTDTTRLWTQPPYNYLEAWHLAQVQWWEEAIQGARGASRHSRDLAAFTMRQVLQALSPANFPATNPQVVHRTVKESGANLVRGARNVLDDSRRRLSGQMSEQAEEFVLGEKVAATPGQVVFRNHLFELIQYTPTTDKVFAEPILITPAWIMKYFILDLSPENSMMKFLVGQGHTVFMVSWKNPDAAYRDVGFDDYVKDGFLAALDAVTDIVPGRKVHAVGYCIGGTLLSIAASYMATQKDKRLKTITLFAAQNDFDEAGELLYFVDESQLAYLEDVMWQQGYLDGDQMSVAFSMLRSKELVWAKIIEDYYLGERRPIIDLIAWNENNTRLPLKMQSDYLRRLFLNNDLAEGRYDVAGTPVSLSDIRVPVFAVATEKDHIAPWKSVYKVHLYADTDVTFVLTAKGHNAGIISEPGRKGRSFRILSRTATQSYLHPEKWKTEAKQHDGSWWLSWQVWLANESAPDMVAPPKMGKSLMPAPGGYVLER